MSVKGIDVSKHQGTIDWNKVKKAGVQFAMLRAGFGKNNIDPQFKRNAKECNRLGIPVGVYWFSYAYTEAMAKQEAAYCLAAIKPYKIEYPVCFDLEYDTVKYAKTKGVTIGKTLASKMVQAFCSEIEKAGFYAMNYSNQDYLKNMFTAETVKEYDLWYAYYNPKCDRSDQGIWQHSSTGKVSGITGNVDQNIAYRDYPTLIKKAGLNGLKSELDKAAEAIQKKAKLTDAEAAYLKKYPKAQELLQKLAKPMK